MHNTLIREGGKGKNHSKSIRSDHSNREEGLTSVNKLHCIIDRFNEKLTERLNRTALKFSELSEKFKGA